MKKTENEEKPDKLIFLSMSAIAGGNVTKTWIKNFFGQVSCVKDIFMFFDEKKWNFSVQKKKYNLSGKYGENSMRQKKFMENLLKNLLFDNMCSLPKNPRFNERKIVELIQMQSKTFRKLLSPSLFFLSLNFLFILTAKLFHQLTSQWKLNAYKTVINEKDIKFDVCKTLKSIPPMYSLTVTSPNVSHFFFPVV